MGEPAERITAELVAGAVVRYAAYRSGTNITVKISGFAFGKLVALKGILSFARAEGAETVTVVGEDVLNEGLAGDLVQHGFQKIGPQAFAKTYSLK